MDNNESTVMSETPVPHTAPMPSKDDAVSAQLLPCCVTTINMHAANNPMMVCSECKQIIKCFEQEKAFRNYQRFCASRHRKIFASRYKDWFIVVFRSYDTYST